MSRIVNDIIYKITKFIHKVVPKIIDTNDDNIVVLKLVYFSKDVN